MNRLDLRPGLCRLRLERLPTNPPRQLVVLDCSGGLFNIKEFLSGDDAWPLD